jgi:hypothetical protein
MRPVLPHDLNTLNRLVLGWFNEDTSNSGHRIRCTDPLDVLAIRTITTSEHTLVRVQGRGRRRMDYAPRAGPSLITEAVLDHATDLPSWCYALTYQGVATPAQRGRLRPRAFLTW